MRKAFFAVCDAAALLLFLYCAYLIAWTNGRAALGDPDAIRTVGSEIFWLRVIAVAGVANALRFNPRIGWGGTDNRAA